jgi:ribonuclease HI
MDLPKHSYAFVDGSFNKNTNTYGYGGFLIDQFGVKHKLFGFGCNRDVAKMRNVAGEILGATAAIEKALALGMELLTIFYDYDGVANWPTGKWKCKNPYTKKYAEFVNDAIDKGLKIIFQHVKGHSGILENEEADRIAKVAVGIFKIIKED